MSSACGRGGCVRPFTSELHALTAEPGFCGTPLCAPVEHIAQALEHLGETVAVTANTAAVMTRIGLHARPQCQGEALTLAPEATCLRISPQAVGTTLAVERMPSQKLPPSLQFYCTEGTVLHKSFLTECVGDLDFARLVHKWESGIRPSGAPPSPYHQKSRHHPTPPDPTGDSSTQIDSIFGDNGLMRRTALANWGEELAWRVSPDLVFNILGLASDIRLPLAQAAGNAGVVQIHHGAPERIRHSGSLAVISSGCCTLSIDRSDIEEAWVTCFEADGERAYMLELYDWRYHCVAQFSAPGLPNPGLGGYWRQLVCSMPRLI